MVTCEVITMGELVPAVVVFVFVATAQDQGASDIHHQPDHGNGDCLVEADGNRMEQTGYGLIADQQSDHGEYDGAAESGEVTEFSRSKRRTACPPHAAGHSDRRAQRAAELRHAWTCAGRRRRGQGSRKWCRRQSRQSSSGYTTR